MCIAQHKLQRCLPEDCSHPIPLCKVAVWPNVHAETAACNIHSTYHYIIEIYLLTRSLYALADTICTIFGNVRSELARPDFTSRQDLLPPGALATRPRREAFQGVTAFAL